MSSMRPDASSAGADLVASRRYAIAFSEVWDALLEALGTFSRWTTRDTDSHAGTITVTTMNAIGRLPRDAMLTLRLDDLGRTCLEIRFEPTEHRVLGAGTSARARRLIRRLERMLDRPRSS